MTPRHCSARVLRAGMLASFALAIIVKIVDLTQTQQAAAEVLIDFTARALTDLTVALGAFLITLYGVGRAEGGWAWGVTAVGTWLWLAGDLLYISDLDPLSFGGMPQELYFAYYVTTATALLLLVRDQLAQVNRTAWLDALLAGLVGATLASLLLDNLVTSGFVIGDLIIPVMDLVVVGMLATALGAVGWRFTGSTSLLAGALGLVALSDVLLQVIFAGLLGRDHWDIEAAHEVLSFQPLLMAAGFMLLTLAGLRASPLQQPRLGAAALPAFVVPTLVVATTVGLLVAAAFRSIPTAAVALATAALIGATLRIAITVRELQGLVVRESEAAARARALGHELHASRELLRRDLEEERRRLRQDLHDRLGPALGGLVMQSGAAMRWLTNLSPDIPTAIRLLHDIEQGMQLCVSDVRRMLRGLQRPAALDEVGLVGAIQQQCRALSAGSGEGTAVSFQHRDVPEELPAAVEVAAYLIAVEAVNNVVQHASATHCDVQLSAEPDSLLVEVRDDGTGIDWQQPDGSGLGLQSMRERVQELAGDFHLESRPGLGTALSARLPLA